ncbi:MAG: hypothetical protein LBS62_07240 [Clostridiales bacterium]|jgi:hypothetical protein|nr:hypothetical protein [Clostridiales bacterium]
MAQQFDYPKTETELRNIRDVLYESAITRFTAKAHRKVEEFREKLVTTCTKATVQMERRVR